MKIGYPCINRSIGCTGGRTFRLKSYSTERLIETVQNNLDCLLRILVFNGRHRIFFFRITSDLIPFASHPICTFPWQKHFAPQLQEIGKTIKAQQMRISMHPDPFTLINSRDPQIMARSVKELSYHCQVMDSMGLDLSAKVQIHIGGVYGDKQGSLERFVKAYSQLGKRIKRRLVIENDDRSFTLQDCLWIHGETGIPVLFDVLHHQVNGSGETWLGAFRKIYPTWGKQDGIPMVDYSQQKKGERKGVHAESLAPRVFRGFLQKTIPHDFDVMLEIKDKEKSALKAIQAALEDRRFWKVSI
jgi:UV DNA damage endonuclease